jgi:hypothetical protein
VLCLQRSGHTIEVIWTRVFSYKLICSAAIEPPSVIVITRYSSMLHDTKQTYQSIIEYNSALWIELEARPQPSSHHRAVSYKTRRKTQGFKLPSLSLRPIPSTRNIPHTRKRLADLQPRFVAHAVSCMRCHTLDGLGAARLGCALHSAMCFWHLTTS